MQKIIFCFWGLLTSIVICQTKEITVSGFVQELKSGKNLIGANVMLFKDSVISFQNPFRGTASNSHGYFIIPQVPAGNYSLVVRSIGYKTYAEKITLYSDSIVVRINPNLEQENIELEEVIVKGEKKQDADMSTVDIDPDKLKMIPSMAGEVSVFKSLQLIPGIKALNEFSSGLYIRGGSPDQNLNLVDGVIVYNPAHLGNFSSTFNADAINKVKVIKGAFPAEYGGRLSSVIDVQLRSGTKERESGALNLGLISSQLTLEGPMNDKSTYMFSGRKMYYDLIQKNLLSNSGTPRYNFYDFNAKFNYTLTANDVISISFFHNKDNVYSPPAFKDLDYNISWKNTGASLNWLKVSSRYLLLNSIISYVNYGFNSTLKDISDNQNSSDYFSNSDLKDLSAKITGEYNRFQNSIIKAGLEFSYHKYKLFYANNYEDNFEENLDFGVNESAIDAGFYFQNESTIFDVLSSNLGIRGYYFDKGNYFNIEPRASLAFRLSDDVALKAAYSSAHQFLHLITRNDITLPTDLWYPSTKIIEPGKSIQYTGGLEVYFLNREFFVSVEGYYKELNNLYEFKDSPVTSSYKTVEEAFTKGKGEAYGVELFLQKPSGSLSGWIGYTLSWTKRKFDELNLGRIFYPRYDHRHDVSFVLTYEISKSLSTGISWVYSSGQGISLATGQYTFPEIGLGNNPKLQFDYSARNAFRLPSYHKMDLSFTYRFEWGGRLFETYLSIYNLYNRKNAFAYYTSYNQQTGNKVELKKITLFPFIPTAGINVRF